jgi:hypothetical protein
LFIHSFIPSAAFIRREVPFTDILHDKSVSEYCIAYLLIDRHTSQGQKMDLMDGKNAYIKNAATSKDRKCCSIVSEFFQNQRVSDYRSSLTHT